MAGKYYATGMTDERELIRCAIEKLGLSQLDEFVPERKIIELML